MPSRKKSCIGRRTLNATNVSRFREAHPVDDYSLRERFVKKIKEQAYTTCNKCHRHELRSSEGPSMCSKCRAKSNKFTIGNFMDPGAVPPVLQGLTQIEQMLIARVHPVMRVYQLRCRGTPGQFRYSGNIINVEQDITHIASRLPTTPERLNVIVIRKRSGNEFKDFRVRRQSVLDALRWLQQNNHLYADIEIDDEVIESLPNNDFIAERLPYVMDEPDETTEIEEENVVESSVPINQHRHHEHTIREVLQWPKHDVLPVNEFTSSDYIAQAFPHLFPAAQGLWKDVRRLPNNELTFKEWCNYIMHYDDNRFAKDPRFRFFCLNTMQRHEAIDTARIFAKKNEFTGTLQQLHARLENDNTLIKRLLAFASKIRGSCAYWYQRRLELEAMVNQLGVPTLFLTLSSADLWWPCMFRHFGVDPSSFNENERSMSRVMQQNLNENPQGADEIFTKRVDVFFNILKEKFDITEWWYRFEYQHRGSPHIHAVLWLNGAPDVRTFNTASPDEISQFIAFYDNLISAWDPHPGAEPSEIHPSRLECTDVPFNDSKKMAQLLNRVQVHSRCGDYCLRRKRGKTVCRFKYPKKQQIESTLAPNERGIFEFTPKRNHEFLNDHNKFVSHAWRANSDIKVIASEHAIINYISKYASKGEPMSKDYKSMFYSIINNCSIEAPARTAFCKLINKMIGSRDISACEVHHLLNGEKLFSCSRQFEQVYLGNVEYIEISRHGATNNMLQKYIERPNSLENVSLFEYGTSFEKNKRLTKLKILRVTPQLKEGLSEDGDEQYYKQRLLLHKPFRDMANLMTHCTWKESYINANITQWQLQGVPDESDSEDEPTVEFDYFDWQVVAGGVITNAAQDIDLGRRDIDRQFDWYKTIEYYPNIEDNMDFIKKSKEEHELANAQMPIAIGFNAEQQRILDHYCSQLNNLAFCQQKRTLILGPAGVGKSAVIKEMISITTNMFGDGTVILMAPTGVAANNINGSTIHSALKINSNRGHMKDLQGEAERALQETFTKVVTVIVDEVSMLGLRMLAHMDRRLRQARPDQCDEPLGGLIVYFVGDFSQLPPVLDIPLYDLPKANNDDMDLGKIVYNSFDAVFFLNTIMRQQGDDQREFRNVLSNIANGNVSQNDYDTLASRFTNHNLREKIKFENALRIITTNDSIITYNLNKLRSLCQPVACISAINNNMTAASATSDDCQGLNKYLFISKGSRVILRNNLWTSAGLCNGSIGTVADIIYKKTDIEDYINDFPICILVQFEKYIGPTLYNGLVPITPVLASFKLNGVQCSRRQFPLNLAYAISVHRSQGCTLDQAVVDLGKSEFSLGLTYVALSRVRTIEGLLLEPFPITRLTNISNNSKWIVKKKEFERLKKMALGMTA